MENMHPRRPVDIVLGTLIFYGEEENIALEFPIADPISVDYLFRAAVALHRRHPIPPIPHRHAVPLRLSLGYLIRDLANAVRMVVGGWRHEEQQYRDGLRFALRLEFVIYEEIRNPRILG